MCTIQQITNFNINLLYLLAQITIILLVENHPLYKRVRCHYLVWIDSLFISGSIFITMLFQPYEVPAAMTLFWGLFTLSLMDAFYRILPVMINFMLLISGLMLNLKNQFISLDMAIGGVLTGYLTLWTVAWSYKNVTGYSGIGGGDLRLGAALGAWVGPAGILKVLFWASLSGCLFYWVMVLKGKYHKLSRIPFGVFLSMAGMGVFVLRFSLWHF